MLTFGFIPPYSDAVTIGTPFSSSGLACVALYLAVGGAGDIVWLNAQGQPQWWPSAQAGQVYILGATQIVASATVNGVSRTTTATLMSWAGVQLYNSP
jgi:predicted anti-sigma-YlaC factor YlaD